jgi:hypothetical protein
MALAERVPPIPNWAASLKTWYVRSPWTIACQCQGIVIFPMHEVHQIPQALAQGRTKPPYTLYYCMSRPSVAFILVGGKRCPLISPWRARQAGVSARTLQDENRAGVQDQERWDAAASISCLGTAGASFSQIVSHSFT